MKTSRYLILLTVVLLLSFLMVPAAAASDSAGKDCPTVHYRIRQGDQLGRIAARYGVSVRQLQKWNGIRNADRIYAGRVLVIYPTKCAKPAPAPRPAPKPAYKPAHAPKYAPPPKPAPAPWPHPAPAPWPHPAPAPKPAPMPWYGGHGMCVDQRAVITYPHSGAHVWGMLTVTGSAYHDNFSFYKLEYGAGSNPSTWSWFAGGETQVSHGVLGTLYTGNLPSGTYAIRLTVVDKTSNYPSPCQVVVRIN